MPKVLKPSDPRDSKAASTAVVLHLPHGINHLPDNKQWTNRFEIRSSSSNRLYIVAQHITKRHWACSCPGWIAHRNCKHLSALGLPAFEKPHEIKLVK